MWLFGYFSCIFLGKIFKIFVLTAHKNLLLECLVWSKYQSGFCKYKDKCRRNHCSENCEDKSDCRAQNCPKTHPKVCKNITKCGKCKYGDKCAYNHDALTKEKNYATLLEAVAHVMKKHDDEILDMKQELHRMTSKVSWLEKEMSLLVESVCGKKPKQKHIVNNTTEL